MKLTIPKETLDRSVDAARGAVEVTFSTHGSWLPCAFMTVWQTPEGQKLNKPCDVAVAIGDFRDKAKTYGQLREISTRFDAAQVIFAAEAWMLKVDSREDVDKAYAAHGSISKAPDRVEAVIVSVVRDDGSASMWAAEIDRSGPKPSLKPWTHMDGSTAEGNMLGVIHPPAAKA